MDYDARLWQWGMSVVVYHGPAFGHYLELASRTRGRQERHRTGLGNWKGLGVPESVLSEARALIDAKFTEHLVTRYGIQGELPMKWSGEPDPF